MLDKIPMALIRRARNDERALQELCELLRPSVEPLIRSMAELTHDAEFVERWFSVGVRAATHLRAVESVDSVHLSGLALAGMLTYLRESMSHVVRKAGRKGPLEVLKLTPDLPDSVLGGGGSEAPASTPLSVYVDLATMAPDDVVELLVGLSDLYRSIGGDGLVVRTVGTMEPALLPAGA